MTCHSYLFFDTHPSFRTLEKEKRDAEKEAFTRTLGTLTDVHVSGYSLVGFKAGMQCMFHMQATDADVIQNATRTLLHTKLGAHLKLVYTLLGLQRQSQYRTGAPKEEKEFVPGAMKYLIVYPFTKTTEWHLLPFEERRSMMGEHVMVAKKHSHSINQLLLYSYGIDDHEFIVSYQTESLHDFQTLVMDLRNTKGRAYTKNDLPIFTCVYSPLDDLIANL